MTAQRWLSLAASPSFAAMMLASLIGDGDPAAMLCSAAGVGSLGNMTVMYALMALFHAGPWLELAQACRKSVRRV